MMPGNKHNLSCESAGRKHMNSLISTQILFQLNFKIQLLIACSTGIYAIITNDKEMS